MPRLLTGDMNNKMYVALEVALACYLVHAMTKNQSMEVKALMVGGLFALYEVMLEDQQKQLA